MERLTHMTWKAWLIVLLIALNAGWMIFDGARALSVGDYVTPSSGEYAGQLGPWSTLVKAVGIEPRSTFVKAFFVSYGVTAIALTGCYTFGLSWARSALIVVSVLGLWYLPLGTLINILALMLLFITRR